MVWFLLPFSATIVSPGKHGPLAWSEPSPSSRTGAVTAGSCLSATSWVKVMPISLAQADYEASLMLLICKITLNPCAAASPSPQTRLVGVPEVSQATPCSEPHSIPITMTKVKDKES